MATVTNTHVSTTAASSVEFKPNIARSLSGIFQASNVCESGTNAACTVTLSGKLSSTHEFQTIKSFSLTSANTSTTATNTAVVTLMPDMKITWTEDSGNCTVTASVLH